MTLLCYVELLNICYGVILSSVPTHSLLFFHTSTYIIWALMRIKNLSLFATLFEILKFN